MQAKVRGLYYFIVIMSWSILKSWHIWQLYLGLCVQRAILSILSRNATSSQEAVFRGIYSAQPCQGLGPRV